MIWEKMLKQPIADTGVYNPNAVKFDGANDYLIRTTPTGVSDSKSGICSFWLRVDESKTFRILSASDTYVDVIFSANKMRFKGATTAGVQVLDINTTASYYPSAKWLHFLASWDLAANASHIYVSDISDQTVVTRTNSSDIDYTRTNYAVGATTDPIIGLNGALAELYFAPGQYLDFSVTANRRKFIDASGLPVDLGSTGATPTGVAPAIYLKGDKTNFGTNSGTGGNFTINGALEKASTTPATLPAFNAVKYTAATDYLTKASDLTGLSDGKTGLFSAWVRLDGSDGVALDILGNAAPRFYVGRWTDNKFQVVGKNTAGTTILDRKTAATYLASPQWRHVLISWDLAATTVHMYVDGVSDIASGTTTNDTIDYASTAWSVLYTYTTSGNCAFAELYFAPNQYLDLSVQANREKFILNGAPASLGSDGSLPTGTAPAIYLPNRAALVGTNAGTGGNFTINGAPKDANSTPLYYYAEPVKFDGTNDYLTRGAGLTGAADGYTGTISFWLRTDGGSGSNAYIFTDDGGKCAIYKHDTTDMLWLDLYNAAGTAYCSLRTTVAMNVSPVWQHVLFSWNTNAIAGAKVLQAYINNVNAAGVILDSSAAFAVDYTRPDCMVGAITSGTLKMTGAIADLWFNTTYLDISQSSNRAKFIDQSTLRPVPLGAKGELPTGSQPLLYLGRDFSNFQTNLGSGGNFTVTGALERATTSPSDVRS